MTILSICIIIYIFISMTVFVWISNDTDFRTDEIELRIVVSIFGIPILFSYFFGFAMLISLNFCRINYYKYTCEKILRTHKWKIKINWNSSEEQPCTLRCKNCGLSSAIDSDKRKLDCRTVSCGEMLMKDVME